MLSTMVSRILLWHTMQMKFMYSAIFHNTWHFNLISNILFTQRTFLTYITLVLFIGNYEQGDENRQLGAKLDDLKIDIEGDDDDDSGHHGVCHWLCLTFYIPVFTSILFYNWYYLLAYWRGLIIEITTVWHTNYIIVLSFLKFILYLKWLFTTINTKYFLHILLFLSSCITRIQWTKPMQTPAQAQIMVTFSITAIR